MPRPDPKTLLGKDFSEVPASLQRILKAGEKVESVWIGPGQAAKISKDDLQAYGLAHKIMAHLCIQAPTKHKSGHPGGPLSSFTFAYFLRKRRNYMKDQPLRMSAGHLSLLAYGLEWLFGNEGKDPRLASPQAIIDCFRTPSGLPGHAEAGIGSIPFGAGPLGKGVSNGLGVAFGMKYLKKSGAVDVLMADGDSQEGQIMEAFRLAAHLRVDNLVVHGDFNDIQLSDMPSKTVAADFAGIAHACGWRVIEVQNGNDPAQVVAALEAADGFLGNGSTSSPQGGQPIFICYYTTMGHGVRIMEEGSNTGAANFHGSPLKDDVAAAALKELPPLDDLVKEYEPFRKKLVTRNPQPATASALPFSLPKGYTRTIISEKGSARTEFGAVHIKNLMKVDPRIVVLHADLAGSGGYDKVGKEFPDRVINVGVAEANMYMMAAGMRQAGLLPVTYTFAAFGTNEARANARLIDVNCGHTRCAVMHDCTHAGVSVGEDGETHQDRNYLNIPFDHTQVWMPADSNQAAAAAERGMQLIAEGEQSMYVFFPRSGHEQIKTPEGKTFYDEKYVFDGKINRIRGKGDVSDCATIIATGITVHAAIAAAEAINSKPAEGPGRATRNPQLSVRVLNVSCIRPFDAAAIIEAALETTHLIVVEDHHSEGGLASQVADVIADFQLPCSLRRLGVNRYYPSATDKDLFLMAGLDSDSILDAVLDELTVEVRGGEDALLTAIYTLPEHIAQSRFQTSAQGFAERVITDKQYLPQLRAAWAGRAGTPDVLPTNEKILEKLETLTKTIDVLVR